MTYSRAALTVACLMTLAACGGGASPTARRVAGASKHTDVRVAVAWPWVAGHDIRFGDGLQMALDEVNGAGGVHGHHVTLVRYDDHGSVDEGELVAQRIAADPSIVAVIGHLQSHVSIPAAAIYDGAGVVMLSPATTDPELTSHGYKRVFRGTFTDQTVGEQMAQYAGARGYRRTILFYVRDAYGRGLANAFEEEAARQGVEVVARQSYDANDQMTPHAFDAALRSWKPLEYDAIFVAGEVPSAGAFIAAARKAGITVPIFGGDAMSSGALVASAGAAAEGVVVASMFHPDEPRAEVRTFTAAFTKRFGRAPDAGAALGYDALHLLVDAMRRAPTLSPDGIAAAVRETHAYAGVTGPFTFDSVGDVVHKPVVKLVVRNGQFDFLGDPHPTVAMATGAHR